jgi:hypothetical protein
MKWKSDCDGSVRMVLEAAGRGLLYCVNLTFSYRIPGKTWKDRKEEKSNNTKKREREKTENIERQ